MGLFLRDKVWWASFTVDGVRYKRSTGTTDEKLAKKVWAKIQIQIVEKKWFDIDNAKRYSYDEMMDQFMEKYAPKKEPATKDMYKYARKHLDPYFCGNMLGDITEEMVANYMDGRILEGAKPATVNREYSTLSKAFNEAYKKWNWIKSNPRALVPKLEESNIPRIWLTAEQEKILLEKAERYLHGDLPDIIILGNNTGLRREEILSLRLVQINLSGRAVTVLKTKNKEPRTVPMNDTVYELLERRLAGVIDTDNYLFSTANGSKYQGRNVLRALKAAVKQANKDGANIGRFWVHGLRHTFGTRLAQAGKNTRQIGELMGIKSEKVLRRYTHFSVESLRPAVESLDSIRQNNEEKIK